ncbi:hypothetical protein CAPTEDRAFT_1723 [Capitella teleta]|uniref:Major facilitator superfamily (MFS) profile domain-containing protein n=1 Tax=Capitella teleta TaxID=283909 RepID=R7VA55_CAPTE|nr:hypothetical protein CAPTEDRAFT_1723 [Capitella teleta]|eukprot:ELU13201.1 hypothetical protein CAPTEDRAFT_1723 [Capitella teleta]
MAGLVLGFTFGFSSPAIPDLEDRLGPEETSWFGSVVTLGAVMGAPLGAVVIEKLGRKGTLIAVNVPYGLGWLCIIVAELLPDKGLLPMLLVGRILCGLAVGVTAGAQPIYVAEVATKQLRGLLGTSLQLTINIGILIMFALGLTLYYRFLAIIPCCVSVLMVLAMAFMPETPRHLVNKGRDDDALKALRWLRGPDFDCRGELIEIQQNLATQPKQSLHISEFTRREVLRPLIIAVGLMVFQDASGINAVLFYADGIMEQAGFEGKGGLASVVIAIILVVMVFPASALTDRAGRKTLLIISQVFIVISLVTFGLYFYLSSEHEMTGLSALSMTSLIVYISAFCLGMGPIAYVVVGEIFPMRVRGVATSITVCLHWIVAFIITKTFSIMLTSLQPYGTFWFYAGTGLVGLIFTVIIVPETKGKSLEEIEASFSRKTSDKKRPLAERGEEDVDDRTSLHQEQAV